MSDRKFWDQAGDLMKAHKDWQAREVDRLCREILADTASLLLRKQQVAMIHNPGAWRGYPGHWIGERWVATKFGWRRMTARWRGFGCEAEQHAEGCSGIGQEFHHRFGRGAGKRDDRLVLPDGTINMIWLSRPCHIAAKIERKGEQVQSSQDERVCLEERG